MEPNNIPLNIKQLTLRVEPSIAYNDDRLKEQAAQTSGISKERIKDILIVKRSIDARQKKVMINLTLEVYVDRPAPTLLERIADRNKLKDLKPLPENAPVAIVVGAGPAGLFAARSLLENGIRPIILERGKDVDSRRLDVAQIARQQKVDPESNYCFGEGGAGTFSDGKLYTRSHKRGPVDKVLATLVLHGANPAIMADAHPHIGTDKLPYIVKNLRQEIERLGGKVMFSARVDELILTKNTKGCMKVIGVKATVKNSVGKETKEMMGPVILATGHSARDTYEMLFKEGVKIEPKGIAVGVRLEHPQKLIDSIFYHNPTGRGAWLPPAEYSVLTRVDGRAVYSFCMCPGGVVVPAATAPGEIVVNGMSSSSRGSKLANSGLVVEILPEDVEGDNPLKLMEYQKKIEKTFSEDTSGTMKAAAQRMTDFVNGKKSQDLNSVSYPPGVYSGRIDKLLPNEISRRLQKGFVEFGRKYPGFLTREATVIGCETRTSSPVRVSREPANMMSVNVEDLYPCGEGAGYAGGIVSAAIDGIRCAEALSSRLTRPKIKSSVDQNQGHFQGI